MLLLWVWAAQKRAIADARGECPLLAPEPAAARDQGADEDDDQVDTDHDEYGDEHRVILGSTEGQEASFALAAIWLRPQATNLPLPSHHPK